MPSLSLEKLYHSRKLTKARHHADVFKLNKLAVTDSNARIGWGASAEFKQLRLDFTEFCERRFDAVMYFEYLIEIRHFQKALNWRLQTGQH